MTALPRVTGHSPPCDRGQKHSNRSKKCTGRSVISKSCSEWMLPLHALPCSQNLKITWCCVLHCDTDRKKGYGLIFSHCRYLEWNKVPYPMLGPFRLSVCKELFNTLMRRFKSSLFKNQLKLFWVKMCITLLMHVCVWQSWMLLATPSKWNC